MTAKNEVKEHLKDRLTVLLMIDTLLIVSGLIISFLGVLSLKKLLYTGEYTTGDFWLDLLIDVMLVLFIGIGMFAVGASGPSDHKKENKRFIAYVEKRTEEQLTQRYVNEANISLIKTNDRRYFLPDHPDYEALISEKQFTTEKDALMNNHFPASTPENR